MRDIEFRAFTSDGMVTPYMWISKDNLPCYKLGSSPKAPLMQYTGLKDSKGVKIFEGDVVSIFDSCDGESFMSGIVQYGFNGLDYPAFEIYDKKGRTYSDEYNTFTNEELSFQVVGNIYEHPHLLESKQ